MTSRKAISTAIKLLCNAGFNFPKNANPEAMGEVWRKYLRDVEDSEFAAAMNVFMQSGDGYWPSVGRIRQCVPRIARRAIESQDESDRAYSAVLGVVSRHGVKFDISAKPMPDDPVKADRLRAIRAAVAAVGGWKRICMAKDSEQMHIRSTFRRAYDAFVEGEEVNRKDPNKRIATHHPTSAALQVADVFKEIAT